MCGMLAASYIANVKGAISLLPSFIKLFHLAPVDHVEERGDVVRAAVLVVQVVGMLPDVEAQDWQVPMQEGAVLVGGAAHVQLAAFIKAHPGPAAAEARGRGLGELLAKAVETAE